MIEECLIVEFHIKDGDCPLAEAAQQSDVTIDAHPPQLRRDGNALLRFSSLTSEKLVEILDADNRIRFLHVSRSDDRNNYRCLSKQPSVVHELVSAGFMIEELQYRSSGAVITGAVVGHDVLQGVMETAAETVGVNLERIYPLKSDEEGTIAQQWDITPRQEESIRTALDMGYFEIPRDVSAEGVADQLGISKSAFLERLHRGERALFEQLIH
ncbi:HTH DNA binding domain-containing protein [Halogranum amylolyticum]|uniref:HTH DNA binding domain-containing protein n=1 Tax=Halogranum amylolyticum TaxID=660520 RepID=A0A1H8WR29_9EURY|nr:helix-turn-helix domain-containing protein [Halogranum amylolyticum]SEP30101.1 HTH DNA binding domain-containing protein [Halogranum amylolyticum]